MITMLVVPITPWTLLAGFLIFRFFDIVKPWPIILLDRHLKGGVGIMMDDILAGLMSAAILWLAYLYWTPATDWLLSLIA